MVVPSALHTNMSPLFAPSVLDTLFASILHIEAPANGAPLIINLLEVLKLAGAHCFCTIGLFPILLHFALAFAPFSS